MSVIAQHYDRTGGGVEPARERSADAYPRITMSTQPLVLAIDQGTSNNKAILVEPTGSVVALASRPMAIEYPRPGWLQQDAGAIWQSLGVWRWGRDW
jgi:hypothetical protein